MSHTPWPGTLAAAREASPAPSPPGGWPHCATVIAYFTEGSGRFRLVCRPQLEPVVEVRTRDTLGDVAWKPAKGLRPNMVTIVLREALLKAFAILPPFNGVLYAPGVVARDQRIEIELGSLAP